MPRHREKFTDKYGRELYKGETERPGGTYQYKQWNPQTKKTESVSSHDLKELRAKEKDLQRNIAVGIRPTDDTVDDYFKDWIECKHLRDTTENGYHAMYEKWIRPEYGKTKVVDMQHRKIEAYYNKIMRENGLTAGAIANINNVLSQVLEEAVNDRTIVNNPCDHVLKDIRKDYPRNHKYGLTIEEQKRFREVISWPENKDFQPLYLFLLDTGLRIGEASGLTWNDVEDGTISVKRSLGYYPQPSYRRQKAKWHAGDPKTESGKREIPINDSIRHDLELQKSNGYKCDATVDGITGFIFGNRYKNPIMDSGINSRLKTLVKNANQCATDDDTILPKITAHTFRHTFTSNMVRANVGVASASVILGHANFETTMDVYNQVQDIQKQEAMKAMDDFREHMK